ncbi:MAG TPA: protein kinase [Acidimicrobiales bacterium]|nr:protein kinase [Acidimicrobiales bacterium]
MGDRKVTAGLRTEREGTAVGGRYELHELLGRGGMGSVWRGEDQLLQRPVAVKRVELPAHLPEDERATLRSRVLREARAAARVSHPRLVTIFDVVEEEGTVFLVQELVDAPTLKQLVTERGPLRPTEVARIGVQLAEGLAAAHANGVIHRDVKPSNVMVRDDGSVKLADFGIASVSGDPQITGTGVVIGSPAYMAPEQATGETVGAAADVWSLAATLYFAVEGVQPFGKSDTLSTLTAVVHEPPRTTTRAGALDGVLTRLLDKDPDSRPSVAEAARLLERAQEAQPTAAMTQVRSAGYVEPDRTVVRREVEEVAPEPVYEPMRPARAPGGGGPRLGAIAAVLVLLIGGGIALALMLANRDDTGRDALDAGGDPSTETTAAADGDDSGDDEQAPSPTTAPAATAAPATPAAPAPTTGKVPAGWTTYTDGKTGYTIAHPEGWRAQNRSGNRTDFTDPATGSYLRVDWTDTPGESAQADWERQSDAFGAKQENYREIGIQPTTFAGSSNASLWEYSYTSGGGALHAYNLGFVLPDRSYGFALNFQTREDRWAASQGLWEQLKAGFTPPS